MINTMSFDNNFNNFIIYLASTEHIDIIFINKTFQNHFSGFFTFII